MILDPRAPKESGAEPVQLGLRETRESLELREREAGLEDMVEGAGGNVKIPNNY